MLNWDVLRRVLKDDKLNDLIARGQSLDGELQELMDRMWTLLQNRKELQAEYLRQYGNQEIEIGFRMNNDKPQVTGIKVKPQKDKQT